MTAIIPTIIIKRGNTFEERFVFPDTDLSTFSFIGMDLRYGKTSQSKFVHAFRIGDGLTTEGVGNNELIITYSSIITKSMGAGDYYRDFLFVTGNNVEVYTKMEGTVRIEESITVMT